jgi:hypothetical protein
MSTFPLFCIIYLVYNRTAVGLEIDRGYQGPIPVCPNKDALAIMMMMMMMMMTMTRGEKNYCELKIGN